MHILLTTSGQFLGQIPDNAEITMIGKINFHIASYFLSIFSSLLLLHFKKIHKYT